MPSATQNLIAASLGPIAGKIKAIGSLVYFGMFQWMFNEGFCPVGGAGQPTYVGPGDYTITLLNPAPIPGNIVALCFAPSGGVAYFSGMADDKTLSVQVKSIEGAPCSLGPGAGWNAGAPDVLGALPGTDAYGLFVIVLDMS